MTGGLGKANISRDHSTVGDFGKVLAYLVHNLMRQVVSRIEHRQENALDVEFRV